MEDFNQREKVKKEEREMDLAHFSENGTQ